MFNPVWYTLSLTIFGKKCWQYTFTDAAELSEFIAKWFRDMPIDWFLEVHTHKWEQ